MHQNSTKSTKTRVYSPMGWITCVCCQKFRWDFMARTFALIAPVQPISHRVSCSNETIQNAPKHYKTHQFLNLASNGVDRVCSLRKTMMQCRGTNLLHKFNPFCNEFRVVTKHCQMHRNNTKCSRTWVWFQCVRSSAFFAKNFDATLWHKLVH